MIAYKFRDWENDDHKKMISENLIHFSSPSCFNDPFDSAIPFRYDFINDKEVFEAYCRVIKHENPGLSRQQIIALARKEVKKGYTKGDEYLGNAQEITEKYNANMFGIFSIAGTYDNILMWSHYGVKHKGFVVCFNYENLVKFCTEYFLKKGKALFSEKVHYQADYPRLIPTIEKDFEFMIRPLTIKSDIWSYESEYRLIVYEGPNEDVKLPDGIIEGIIFGCSMTADYKKEINKIIGKKNINIIETRKHKEKFGFQYRKFE